jgi:adenylate cyclase
MYLERNRPKKDSSIAEERELMIAFSSISGFMALAEKMTPVALHDFLNTYLTAMSGAIFEHGGTIDKYIADTIECFWGAPVRLDEHALHACRFALCQMSVLEELNKRLPQDKRIKMRIGINTGVVAVGAISTMRQNLKVIGDAVNFASRLESMNKLYSTNILVSENTYTQVKDQVIVRELDVMRVIGKNRPVSIRAVRCG